MYKVDEDSVAVMEGIPLPDRGAPLPAIVSDEFQLLLGYITSQTDPGWNGTDVNVISPSSGDMLIVIVKFINPRAHLSGPPSDEIFSEHPLAPRGLNPYSIGENKCSSWIRALEKMNSVHPCHRSEYFANLRHYVFAFHDSVFECVAEGLNFELCRGTMRDIVQMMAARLADSSD